MSRNTYQLNVEPKMTRLSDFTSASGLTRARPAGHIRGPHRFFADCVIRAASSAAKVRIAIHLSFTHRV